MIASTAAYINLFQVSGTHLTLLWTLSNLFICFQFSTFIIYGILGSYRLQQFFSIILLLLHVWFFYVVAHSLPFHTTDLLCIHFPYMLFHSFTFILILIYSFNNTSTNFFSLSSIPFIAITPLLSTPNLTLKFAPFTLFNTSCLFFFSIYT